MAKLKHITEEMEKAFLDFNNKATAAGLFEWATPLAQDMKTTMENLVNLAQAANLDSDAEDDEQSPAKPTESRDLQPNQSTTTDQSSLAADPSSPPGVLGYELAYDDIRASEYGLDQHIFGTGQGYNVDGNPDPLWGNMSMMHQYHAEMPDPVGNNPYLAPKLHMSMKTPSTYSFQESTFARRLLRSTIERAYKLITNPDANPDTVHRVFRFSFCYSKSNIVSEEFRRRLMRSGNESLEHWTAPRFHLGGAGLHYPRTPLDGDSRPPSNWWASQPMGPSRLIDAETPIADASDPELVAKMSNADGTWLDPSDVEHYLRAKGLYLDGDSSIAEMEIEISPTSWMGEVPMGSPDSSSVDSFQGPLSPRDGSGTPPYLMTQSSDYFLGEMISSLPSFQLPMTEGVGMDFSGAWPNNFDLKGVDGMGAVQQDFFAGIPATAHVPLTRKVIVDVDRLVVSEYPDFHASSSCSNADRAIALNRQGCCIGRSPGWRVESVESALNAALQEAF